MARFVMFSSAPLTIADLATSTQSVSLYGAQGTVTNVNMQFGDVAHGNLDDLDMLLSGPGGATNLMFWSDAGGPNALTNGEFVISDFASNPLPDATVPPSFNSYRPTNFDSAELASGFGSPAGGINFAGPDGAATFATAFGGIAPNGAWSLFAADDQAGGSGSIGFWLVSVTTSSNAVVIEGTSGDDTLVIDDADKTYSLNGGQEIHFSQVDSLTFNGGGGDDTLILSDNGSAVFGLPGGVNFNGGTNNVGGDRLVIEAGGGDVAYTFSGPGGGNVVTYSGTINFTGAEAVDSGILGDTVFNLAAGPDTVTLQDDGIAGNGVHRLSGSTIPTVTFAMPNSALTLNAGAGDIVNIDLADQIGDSLTIGDIANPAARPDAINVGNLQSTSVTLAASGAVSEWGNDAEVDIAASTLAIAAGTGIGAAGALETDIVAFEAHTDSGGIAIVDQSGLQFVGASDALAGLSAGTGNIDIRAYGDILLDGSASAFDFIVDAGAGNVRLEAIGAESSIFNYSVNGLVQAQGGDIALIAGQDIDFGGEGGGDTRANGAITLSAGRDILLQNDADIRSDDFNNASGGGVTATSGRNITLLGTVDIIANGVGTTSLATGSRGTLTANFASTVSDGGRVLSGGGDVAVAADRMVLANSGFLPERSFYAQYGDVTLNAVTAGRAIRLGNDTGNANALELSDAELQLVTAARLILGGESAGTLTVAGAIATATVTDFSLVSGGSIAVNALVQAANALSLQAANNLALSSLGNLIAGIVYASVDIPDTDAGTGGSFTHASALAATLALTGAEDGDTLNGGDGADFVIGNGGDDSLSGGGGADTLDGGLGNDTLLGGTGADTLAGDAGNDTLSGGGDGDSLLGGADNDTYVDPIGDTIVENLGEGTDTVTSAVTFSIEAIANVERLFLTGNAAADATGNSLANHMLGNDRINTLNGRDGNDTINGGGGADTINGGSGADRLTGGLQRDKIVPGTDTVRDTIVFTLIGESTGHTGDVIEGLDLNNEDKIDLPGTVSAIAPALSGALSLASFNANLAGVFNAAALPVNSAALFTPTSGDLVNPNMVYLIVDANGIAGYQANQDWVFQLENHTGALDTTDFV